MVILFITMQNYFTNNLKNHKTNNNFSNSFLLLFNPLHLLSKINKMKTNILALFLLFALFTSCKKTSTAEDDTTPNCVAPYIASIATNSPVVVGWPIDISTSNNMYGYYTWFSPSGGTLEQKGFTSSSFYGYYKSAASFSDSGTYRLEVKINGCLQDSGNFKIKIIAPPTPPCTTTNNTSTSNVIGVGGDTYTSRDFNNNVITAYPSIGSSEGALHFSFWGNTAPKPGKYKTNGSTFSGVETEVGCWLTYFPGRQFINKANQDVYVNMVNGKMQISFCSCGFTNPIGASAITISARITQP
jgi:hypothetical protein